RIQEQIDSIKQEEQSKTSHAIAAVEESLRSDSSNTLQIVRNMERDLELKMLQLSTDFNNDMMNMRHTYEINSRPEHKQTVLNTSELDPTFDKVSKSHSELLETIKKHKQQVNQRIDQLQFQIDHKSSPLLNSFDASMSSTDTVIKYNTEDTQTQSTRYKLDQLYQKLNSLHLESEDEEIPFNKIS
ncbi:hypothetical protein AKO1_009518, partial [Acrasis kona]